MNDLAAILEMGIFFGYAAWIYGRYGVLMSVSTSTYRLQGNDRYWFWAALTAMGLVNLVFTEVIGAWAFFATAGICFAGVTVNFREFAYGIHTGGTALSVVATFTGIWIHTGAWLPALVVVMGIAAIFLFAGKNRVWWLELWSMGCAGVSFLLVT